MDEYYVKCNGILIFNDIDYSYDYEHWNNDNEWEYVPDHSRYLISTYGEIMRKSDSFLVPPEVINGVETVYLINDDTELYNACDVEQLMHIVFPEDSTDEINDDNFAEQDLDNLLNEMSNNTLDISTANNTLDISTANSATVDSIEPYLSNYPIIVTDNDGCFVKKYPSIRNMIANTHGTEGWDPMVIYHSCNSPEWYKCYGKMIRWDQIMYMRHELEQKLRDRRID